MDRTRCRVVSRVETNMGDGTDYRLLGEMAVYPGHSVTLAYIISKVFPDLETADRREEGHDFSNALESQHVPGAGGNVHSAMRLLRELRKGVPVEEVLALAERQWAQCDDQKTLNPARYNEGKIQAEKLRERFLTEVVPWAQRHG